ncbi:MAG: InlB B-repeat-containing protein, partial [Clostridia bacterium]|nr:InlB B-repeat-containing protein [Clostridia bacterium]
MRKIKQICLTFICSCFMGALTIGGAACGGDKQVTLSFNTNGGASVADVKLDVGENYVLQPLTREGYSFEGWYTSEDFSGEAVTEVVANSSVTYYAKWEQLYLVTLDLNDGELDYGKLYLKAGDVIYDSVKDFAPTKTGCQFGDWFVDEDMNKVLGKNTRMTENGITLYAKYKTSYTVEIWTEKLDEKGVYEKTADDVIGYEYAGVEYTSEQKVTGFREIVLSGDTYNSVTELTISETASENVFKHYFNRETYTVSFNANYPDGAEGKEYSVPVVYGNGVEVPSNYTYNGYCLMGWEVNGTVYDAKYIENALYGNETDVEADKFFPERNTTLYAVWQKGYVDMFGNGDYIYLFEDQVENEETGEVKTKYSVYLSRAGILFKGTYQASSQRFTFTNLDNDTTLQGKLNEDGTFIYRDQNRASITYERFVFGKGISNTEKIFFDDYNGVTYSVTKTVNGEEISDKSYGTFTINEDNLFVAVFTEGTLAGQTLTMTLGYVSDTNGSYARAFQIRNDKELEFGEMIRFAVGLYEGNTYVNYYIYYGLTLNGFNTATVCEGDDKYVNYNYVYNEETSMLYLYEQGQSTPKQTCQIMELECFDGQVRKGYAVYNENLASSFYYAGGELVLDGYLNFTYERADGSVLEGYYTATESILGGMLVSFLDGKQLHNVVIERQEFALGGQTMVTYTVDEKSENYAEYYYLGNSGLLPYPVFVVNGDTASFYTHSSSAGYLEASRGTLVYDEATGLYTYTASPDFAGIEGDSLSNLEEVVLSLDAGETYYYSLHYWYSYKDKEGGALNYDESYTSAKGSKLTLVSGMAIYEEDGSIIKGIYQKAEDVVAIQNAKGELVYVKVDDENKTFVKMEYAPYTAYLYIGKDQVLSNSESISFDGLGGATYIVKTTVDEEPVETKYQGTVVKEDTTTLHGAYIFRFIPSEGEEVESFRFIQLTLGQYAIFAKEEKGVATVYESAEGRLELDGFGYLATYESVTGTYYFLSETEIVVDLNGEVRYFDVEGNTFTLRGKEYGYYMYSRNQYTYDVDFLLDGYGKLTVITYDKDGNESRVEGTYTQ